MKYKDFVVWLPVNTETNEVDYEWLPHFYTNVEAAMNADPLTGGWEWKPFTIEPRDD